METLSAANIVAAVQLANSLREAFGQPRLDDLPKGIRSEDRDCVLARAFNFDCMVGYDPTTYYGGIPQRPDHERFPEPRTFVAFSPENEAQAKKLAELLGGEIRDNLCILYIGGTDGTREWVLNDELPLRVDLPEEVGIIARCFDDGYELLMPYVLEWDEE